VLQAARRARRLASQQLTFVAGITHELRTPLAVIRSAAENLADGLISEPDRVRRYGQLLVGEGRRLSHMVEQAIDFAALEAGARQAPDEVYDVAQLVAELCDSRHADVVTRIASPLPALRGDPAATRLVLGNLVENARKHAPGAPIAIQVDAIEWLAGPGVRIEVTDRGGGIDPADVPHLFEPFYRGKHAREKHVPGSGLGLSVVKRLIEQQRGTIAVRSQPGSGSSFIVHLPGGQ
jgi:signal transduction histidine kinase